MGFCFKSKSWAPEMGNPDEVSFCKKQKKQKKTKPTISCNTSHFFSITHLAWVCYWGTLINKVEHPNNRLQVELWSTFSFPVINTFKLFVICSSATQISLSFKTPHKLSLSLFFFFFLDHYWGFGGQWRRKILKMTHTAILWVWRRSFSSEVRHFHATSVVRAARPAHRNG